MVDVIIGVQARLSSSRLPRKIEIPIMGFDSMLEAIVTKWRTVTNYPVYVIAPSSEQKDNFWKEFSKQNQVIFGSDNNLLKRYATLTDFTGAAHVVRVTADNPLVHDKVLSETVLCHFAGDYDYTTSKSDDGANLPAGIGVEVFKASSLSKVVNSRNKTHQEHVSEAFLENAEMSCCICTNPLSLSVRVHYETMLTMDTLDDKKLLGGLI